MMSSKTQSVYSATAIVLAVSLAYLAGLLAVELRGEFWFASLEDYSRVAVLTYPLVWMAFLPMWRNPREFGLSMLVWVLPVGMVAPLPLFAIGIATLGLLALVLRQVHLQVATA